MALNANMNENLSYTSSRRSALVRDTESHHMLHVISEDVLFTVLPAVAYFFAKALQSKRPYLHFLGYVAVYQYFQGTLGSKLFFPTFSFSVIAVVELCVSSPTLWISFSRKNELPSSLGVDSAAGKPSYIPKEAVSNGNITPALSEQGGLQQQISRPGLDSLKSRGSANKNSLKPWLFPSRTTHRRLFPTTHSFNYSYLLVGIPITQTDEWYGSMLSSHHGSYDKLKGKKKAAWFSVNSTDYLQRGSPFINLSMRRKLEIYLESQSIDPTTFPHAYLVTAPRFLGWSFNPVSFWYLYNSNMKLSAMILEVNNTFDERRMYPLMPASEETCADCDEPIPPGSIRFSSTWQKDFHVSPFNDRDGSYSVRAVDIATKGYVDVTIVLRDDTGKAKLVARVYSDTASGGFSKQLDAQSQLHNSKKWPGFDPRSLSRLQRTRFLIRYGYIGFLTNPRILREARILWVKGLKVFYRPEPVTTTIGRNESSDEIVLEKCFRSVLANLAQKKGMTVEYVPAAGIDRGKTLLLGANNLQEEQRDSVQQKQDYLATRQLRLQVLTPAFYSALTRNVGSLFATIDECSFSAKEREALLSISDETKLEHLLNLDSESQEVSCVSSDKVGHGSIKQACTSLFRNPRKYGWLKLGMQISIFRIEQQKIAMSEFDKLVHDETLSNNVHVHSSRAQTIAQENICYDDYLRCTLLVLLADRVAFGSKSLLTFQISICRVLLVAVMTYSVAFGLQGCLARVC